MTWCSMNTTQQLSLALDDPRESASILTNPVLLLAFDDDLACSCMSTCFNQTNSVYSQQLSAPYLCHLLQCTQRSKILEGRSTVWALSLPHILTFISTLPSPHRPKILCSLSLARSAALLAGAFLAPGNGFSSSLGSRLSSPAALALLAPVA